MCRRVDGYRVTPHFAMRRLDQALVLCMEPIAACLALGQRLSWKMRDKYLVRAAACAALHKLVDAVK